MPLRYLLATIALALSACAPTAAPPTPSPATARPSVVVSPSAATAVAPGSHEIPVGTAATNLTVTPATEAERGTCHAIVLPSGAYLPDPVCTPGATNPAVSSRPSDVETTVCKSGWTATIRPPAQYTTALKIRQLVLYDLKFPDGRTMGPGDVEEDHLVALEDGGNPWDPRNLWPQPHQRPGSPEKDALENAVRSKYVCPLGDLSGAAHALADNWYQTYLAAGSPAPRVGVPAPGKTPVEDAGEDD